MYLLCKVLNINFARYGEPAESDATGHEAASAVDLVELILGYVWLSEVAQQAEPHHMGRVQSNQISGLRSQNNKKIKKRFLFAPQARTSRDVCGALSFIHIGEVA